MSGENIQQVFIVEERDNPSTDYFILPQFQDAKFNVEKFNFDELPNDSKLAVLVVVFVRYLPKKWRKFVEKNRALIKELYFFMDDDLFDSTAFSKQSLKYRWKLHLLANMHQKWLRQNKASIWVSTPYLKEKYQHLKPESIEPKPMEQKQVVYAFYHGSASHWEDILWLRAVLAEVMIKVPEFHFEIIGGQKVKKLFKGLDRVSVVHPMNWRTYQTFIHASKRHIGLVPQLENDFNAARSHTKVFDVQAAKAIGFYAENSESARFVEKNRVEDSLVLPMEQDVWVENLINVSQTILTATAKP